MDLAPIVLFGVTCYLLGFLSGRFLIPWLVDHYPRPRVR